MINIAYILPHAAISGGAKVVLEHTFFLNKIPFISCTTFAEGEYPKWLGIKNLSFVSCNPLKADLSKYDIIIVTFFSQIKIIKKIKGKIIIHFCQGIESDYLNYFKKEDFKDEINTFYKLNIPRITINKYLQQRLLQLGCKKPYNIGQGLNRNIFKPKNFYNKKKDKILIVGNYTFPFKGIKRSLTIAQKIKHQIPEIKIIRVSPIDTKDEEMNLFHIDNYYTSLSPSKMAELYQSSLFSIYFAEKEGFGLPVLESLACGTPVIASNIPPFKEICGNNYPLFRYNENLIEIIDFALKLKNNYSFYNNLVKIGLKRAKRYSYKKVILKLLFYLIKCFMEKNIDEK